VIRSLRLTTLSFRSKEAGGKRTSTIRVRYRFTSLPSARQAGPGNGEHNESFSGSSVHPLPPPSPPPPRR